MSALREWRKYGTDEPHKPTDDFVVNAFAEGARSLWPDSRDPGWHVTFQRWLAARDAAILDSRLAAVEALAYEWEHRSQGFSGIYADADRKYAAEVRQALSAAESPDHIRRENLAVLKHEAETPTRGHDEDGRCCVRARLEATAADERPPA